MLYSSKYRPALAVSQGTQFVCLFGAWVAISSVWAPSPRLAFKMAITVWLYALCVELWMNFGALHQRLAIRFVGYGLVLGFVPAALYVSVEAATGLEVRNTLTNAFPSLRPSLDHMSIDAVGGAHLSLYMLNRNCAVLLCLAWPIALVAYGVMSRPQVRAFLAAVVVLISIAVIAGLHASSKLAAVAGIVSFALSTWRLLVASRITMVAWTVLTLCAVPTALIFETAATPIADRLPYSSAHRLVIWGETARATLKHPIVGAGSGATRAIDAAGPMGTVRSGRHVFPAGMNAHAHNVYLQTWYELGAVGAVIIWAIGWSILRSIASANRTVQPMLLATFATGASMASTSYAYNDPWFIALFGFMVIFVRLGVAIFDDTKRNLTA
jgi:O-antigen ligase